MGKITRRTALKTLLAAAGGIAASTMLPSKWIKPIVTSGVLPAHAQSSVQIYVKGYLSGNTVRGGVTSNPAVDFSYLNGKTGLAQAGGHAKHAKPARVGLEFPVGNVPVTLYLSDTESGARTKFPETNPRNTDVNGFTATWDVTGNDGKWCHFVISGDEAFLQLPA